MSEQACATCGVKAVRWIGEQVCSTCGSGVVLDRMSAAYDDAIDSGDYDYAEYLATRIDAFPVRFAEDDGSVVYQYMTVSEG